MLVQLFKLVLILTVLLQSSSVLASNLDCSKHPIYCSIKTLQPVLDDKLAISLSNLLSRYSKRYGIDPYRAVAIAFQESGFAQVNRRQRVLTQIGTKWEVIEGFSDLSMYQIHIDTATAYQLDLDKLMNNLDYATMIFTRILRDKIELCSELEDEAYSCYHSTTERYRKEYIRLVDRHYQRIRQYADK